MSSSLTTHQEEDEAFAQATYLRSIGTFANVLNAALMLNLFDIVNEATGPNSLHVSAVEVASKLLTKNPDAPSYIDRMLRLLACYNLLTCELHRREDGSIERLYGLTPVGKWFARREDGKSLAALKPQKEIEMVWLQLNDLVMEGGDLFEKVHRMPIYEFLSKNPRNDESFNKAMASLSKITTSKVLDTYKGFEDLASLVDVGGGIGATLSMIISKYPTIKGINFDAPYVVEKAPACPGITHVGGDMFSNIPITADAFMMKNVLHNWNDEQCLKVLRNCNEALPKNGKLIVMGWILPEYPDSSNASKYLSHMDILMIMHGGKQRTENEFKALGKAAGFSDFQVKCFAHYVGIMEFLK
ncbi:caffeic acid 3-O-methyltransferase-like [Mangifera indica]|uniref:caffeic acid 3-O-methyltransferase-like n=1 Tax=Mangifera indica TaxID=29780 RepID=UPI001CF9BBB4|nr:caffeic acid 3-O-methyltransferase-like [Mangifera indica]